MIVRDSSPLMTFNAISSDRWLGGRWAGVSEVGKLVHSGMGLPWHAGSKDTHAFDSTTISSVAITLFFSTDEGSPDLQRDRCTLDGQGRLSNSISALKRNAGNAHRFLHAIASPASE